MSDDTFPGSEDLLVDPATVTYVETGEAEQDLLAQLPEAGAPVTVVRPVRLPFETDTMIKALAQARGVNQSDLIREWVMAGLASAGATPDPVTELRLGLNNAQRALDKITARGVREGRTAA
jgi:hypothetical protein